MRRMGNYYFFAFVYLFFIIYLLDLINCEHACMGMFVRVWCTVWRVEINITPPHFLYVIATSQAYC